MRDGNVAYAYSVHPHKSILQKLSIFSFEPKHALTQRHPCVQSVGTDPSVAFSIESVTNLDRSLDLTKIKARRKKNARLSLVYRAGIIAWHSKLQSVFDLYWILKVHFRNPIQTSKSFRENGLIIHCIQMAKS